MEMGTTALHVLKARLALVIRMGITAVLAAMEVESTLRTLSPSRTPLFRTTGLVLGVLGVLGVMVPPASMAVLAVLAAMEGLAVGSSRSAP